MKGLVVCLIAALLRLMAGDGTCADMKTSHFRVVSTAKTPSPEAIASDLEPTWRTFEELFGVDPPAVEVVISVTAGGGSSADAGTESAAGGASHRIAWTIAEGEPLDGQRFSDLSHEIAHIYFLEYMHEGGLHQPNAWLHEAVACHHEKEPSRRNRAQWIRDRLGERIPLATLFTMRNPVKESPMVELTVQLHEKLARGEISVDELNRQVSAYASSHADELSRHGIQNMTYYAESVSLFEFLLETEGKAFIREMCRALARGTSMDAIVRQRKAYPNGPSELEEAWAKWVRTHA
ncbi:MAG: hypothetical protein E6J79_01645 [Deltaproteobacteria bacterium]|nr:MAG: hypothetical protein E6J79_01645 [Deltaproteobacteria bacterium]